MSQTEVFLYRDEDGSIPLMDWLDCVPTKVKDKCTDRINRLAEFGNELRRPEANFLSDGIYELRATYQRVHYRMLYFFAGKAVVVLSHAILRKKGKFRSEKSTVQSFARSRSSPISKGLQ